MADSLLTIVNGMIGDLPITEEAEVLHGVTLAVTGPESELMNRGSGGNQRVAELNVVAFGKLPQVITCTPPNCCVD
jgi:hypothetical protein